jgi:hypothetical protein
MKKRILTLEQLRKENPFKAGKVISALNRNRVKKKNTKSQNLSADFSRNSITKHIIKSILNN